jgi:hypothetical protein
MKLFDKPANIIVPIILFIILSPGVVLTLPNKTSSTLVVLLTHAAIFGLVYALLLTLFSEYY